MARFFALDFQADKSVGRGAAIIFPLLCLMAFSGTPSQAQSMMQEAAPANSTNPPPVAAKAPSAPNPAPATTKTPPAPTPASAPAAANAKPAVPPTPVPPVPPPVPDTFNRYGKIWAPTDDVAHPIRLNVQFPGVGEMKIPNQDELSVRDKLEQLAVLSDDEIRTQLAQWPPYAKMKLADEGQLLIRIQQFKEQRTRIAMDKARELGLINSLTPDQKARFEKEYWDKKLQLDHELAKQFEPVLKARDQKLKEDLFREFSTPGSVVPAPPGPVAQAKPGTPPVSATPPPNSAAKPQTPAATPIAQGKSAPGSTPPVVH